MQMETKPKESLSSFEVEASLSYPPEKIYKFFTSKSINLTDFALKEKKENSIIYQAIYLSNLQSMSSLELIKTEELYNCEDFKIIVLQVAQEYDEVLKELIEKEKKAELITYLVNYDEMLRTNFMKTHGTEGLEFINQEIIKKQRSVLTYMLKKIGTNLFSGKSIMSVSLPIYIFEPRSLLELFASGYRHAQFYLEKAKEASNLERLKLCTTYAIAVLASQISFGKPFNPLLGETFQAKIGNTEVYLEQTSHHPPILNYYVKNPLFTTFGYSETEINSSANTMQATNKGKFYIKFSDGGLYRFYPPDFKISGIMVGRRYINMVGCMVIEDLVNNIISVINFTKEEKSFVGKLFGSGPKLFPDGITGFISYKNDAKFDEKLKIYKPLSQDVMMSKFEGEWGHYLNCNNVEYWKNGEHDLEPLQKMNYTLPSDSCYRADVILLKNNHEELAQQAKMRLEDIQRYERKLRENKNIK